MELVSYVLQLLGHSMHNEYSESKCRDCNRSNGIYSLLQDGEKGIEFK